MARKDESNEPIVSVMFRRWKDEDKSVIAVFPYILADYRGNVLSYQHVGQHGAASLLVMRQKTKPAVMKESDTFALYKELQRIGYRMRVIKRVRQN